MEELFKNKRFWLITFVFFTLFLIAEHFLARSDTRGLQGSNWLYIGFPFRYYSVVGKNLPQFDLISFISDATTLLLVAAFFGYLFTGNLKITEQAIDSQTDTPAVGQSRFARPKMILLGLIYIICGGFTLIPATLSTMMGDNGWNLILGLLFLCIASTPLWFLVAAIAAFYSSRIPKTTVIKRWASLLLVVPFISISCAIATALFAEIFSLW